LSSKLPELFVSQATTWLKRESEKEAKEQLSRGVDIYKQSNQSFLPFPSIYSESEDGGAAYTPVLVDTEGREGLGEGQAPVEVCQADGSQGSC
jgi:hypothetical protein